MSFIKKIKNKFKPESPTKGSLDYSAPIGPSMPTSYGVRTPTGGVSTATPEEYINKPGRGISTNSPVSLGGGTRTPLDSPLSPSSSSSFVDTINQAKDNKPTLSNQTDRRKDNIEIQRSRGREFRREPVATGSGMGLGGTLKEDVYRRKPGRAFITSTKNILDFGIIGNKGFGSYINNIFEPIREADFGIIRPNINPVWRGTITEGNIPFGYKDTSIMSLGEIKVNQDLARGVDISLAGTTPKAAVGIISDQENKKAQNDFNKSFSPGGANYNSVKEFENIYQDKIDKGELTLSQAKDQFNFATELFTKQKAKDFGANIQPAIDLRVKDFMSKREITDFQLDRVNLITKSPGMFIEGGIKTTALIGLSSTPAGNAAVAGYFYGSSSKNIANALLNKDLTGKERTREFSNTLLNVGIGSFSVNLGLGKSTKSLLSRQNVRELSIGLDRSFVRVTGKELINNDLGQAFKLRGSSSFGGSAVRETDLFIPVFKTGDKTFSISGGKGTVNTRIFDFVSEQTLKSKTKVLLGGRGATTEIKSISLISPKNKFRNKLLTDNIDMSVGSGYFKNKGSNKFYTFKFVGLARSEETVYKVASLNPKSFGMGYSNFRIKGSLKSAGTIEKIPLIGGGNSNFMIPSRTKSSLPFTAQVQRTPSFAQPFIKNVNRVVSLETPIVKNTYSTGAYSGLGLYEKTSETNSLFNSQVGILKKSPIPSLNIFNPGLQTTKTKGGYFPNVSTGSSILETKKASSKVFLAPIEASLVNQAQANNLKSMFKYKMAYPSPSLYGRSFTGNFRFPAIPFLPTFSLDLFDSPKSNRKGRRGYKRMPSLVALEYGITSAKPGPLEFTGLGLRPIIRRRKRR